MKFSNAEKQQRFRDTFILSIRQRDGRMLLKAKDDFNRHKLIEILRSCADYLDSFTCSCTSNLER